VAPAVSTVALLLLSIMILLGAAPLFTNGIESPR